eukprot:COSAG01_NODE_5465_length_4244_cov_54.041255_2_plen_72_part_00
MLEPDKLSGVLGAGDQRTELTVDRLGVAASPDMFGRFDNFNDSYNPLSSRELRSIFMKTGNHIDGEYHMNG